MGDKGLIKDPVISAALRQSCGTEAKMFAVLDALAAGATVLGAERAAGVSRGLANYWRRRDPAFAERMETARASAAPRRCVVCSTPFRLRRQDQRCCSRLCYIEKRRSTVAARLAS